MKQHITEKQFNELSDNEQKDFFGIDRSVIGSFRNKHKDVTIGRMIEFLEDNFDTLFWCPISGCWQVRPYVNHKITFASVELVDALFDSVKNKIKK